MVLSVGGRHNELSWLCFGVVFCVSVVYVGPLLGVVVCLWIGVLCWHLVV